MNRTLLNGRFRLVGRNKWHESAEATQADLDVSLDFYNDQRSRQR